MIIKNQDYYGYVYVTIDHKRDKLYVGQKKGKIEDTKNYYGSGTRISRILKSRGDYFLEKKVLGTCNSREELLEQETECKHFFDAWNPLVGYNIAKKDFGGDTLTHHPDREKRIQKTSESQKGRKAWNKNIPHTKKTKEKIKNNHQDYSGEKNPRFGIKHTKKSKEKMSKTHKGKILTEEHKKNISKSGKGISKNKGIKHTKEHNKKISKSLKGKRLKNKCNFATKYILFTPNNEFLFLYGGITQYCKDNKLILPYLREMSNGERKYYKGYKCIKIL